MVGGGGGVKSFSCQTQLLVCKVELWLSWGCDKIKWVCMEEADLNNERFDY